MNTGMWALLVVVAIAVAGVAVGKYLRWRDQRNYDDDQTTQS